MDTIKPQMAISNEKSINFNFTQQQKPKKNIKHKKCST